MKKRLDVGFRESTARFNHCLCPMCIHVSSAYILNPKFHFKRFDKGVCEDVAKKKKETAGKKGRQEDSKGKNRNDDDSDLSVIISSVIPFIIKLK